MVDDHGRTMSAGQQGSWKGPLNSFPRVMVRGARVLDAGASTGGSQVLLERARDRLWRWMWAAGNSPTWSRLIRG